LLRKTERELPPKPALRCSVSYGYHSKTTVSILNPEASTVKHENPEKIQSVRGGKMTGANSPLFEIALVLVRFDHLASFIVNANHSII
jgi:hypothetical protein